ncbi:MAG: class B sortase [Enterococcus sp.]|nr:class B sortase [Enterococcus sp.]
MNEKTQNHKALLFLILIPVFLVSLAICYFGSFIAFPKIVALEGSNIAKVDPNDPINREINFAELQQINPDIYAWIYIPGTNVDFPVLQHPSDDEYYLHHDFRGNFSYRGAIYSESVNNKDFVDPVTVLYGHNMGDDSMFSTLSLFKDKAFFDTHEYMYIYMPDSSSKLSIISAYVWNDNHIIKNNDFNDLQRLQEYFNTVTAPNTHLAYVRPAVHLNTQDRIIQLSTCWTPYLDEVERYLVTGNFVETIKLPN